MITALLASTVDRLLTIMASVSIHSSLTPTSSATIIRRVNTVKGPARLTHRQRQALATRDLILDTARQLFRDRGYAGTTIEAIAAGAGVAVNTIYASFGSKRSILTAIRLRWLEQAEVRTRSGATLCADGSPL